VTEIGQVFSSSSSLLRIISWVTLKDKPVEQDPKDVKMTFMLESPKKAHSHEMMSLFAVAGRVRLN
jgi:hypothetical protein